LLSPPLSILIDVNDICNAISEHNLKLFADDTNLFLCSRSLPNLEAKANVCLDKLQTWFLANKLSLNIDKTCFTIFYSRVVKYVNYDVNLFIGGKKITKVSRCKYFGLFMDERLL